MSATKRKIERWHKTEIKADVKRWMDYGLSTHEADRPHAEKGIKLAYRAAGFHEPDRIVWCADPMVCILAAATVSAIRINDHPLRFIAGELKSNVLRTLHPAPQKVLSEQDHRWLKGSTEGAIKRRIGSHQRSLQSIISAGITAEEEGDGENDIIEAVRQSLSSKLSQKIQYEYWHPARESASEFLRQFCYGQHDADWLAFYNIFGEIFPLPQASQGLKGLSMIAESAGWFLPSINICWVSERPLMLKEDSKGRLHAEDGPALRYGSGLSGYSWHGVSVPEWVIEDPERITGEDIDEESNQEVRRVMLERYGQDRYLSEGSTILHEDNFGILLRRRRVTYRGAMPMTMVQVLNATLESDGTQKTYLLRVPPEMKTAHQAVAWTFGFTPEEYAPMIES